MKNKAGIISFTAEIEKAQAVISVVNLFLLFIITILFFVFFRRENILFQKAILDQKEVIEEKQKEILDSINYAKRIQYALLASDTLLKQHLPEHFIMFNPKDVVSSDFYWGTAIDDGSFIFITADGTGHGVPGAFMSLLNISKLSQVINENKITKPDLVLNQVRQEIIKALNAEGAVEESKDGMDAVLCKLDIQNMKLEYASANNPFYIIRNNQLLICKPDKMPVGKGHADSVLFTCNHVGLQKNDMIYTFTDGYADQFGGPKGKKFKYKQLEKTLLAIHHLSMVEQKAVLIHEFTSWKGNLDQVDDVLIVGIRLS
ncbi:MAG: SpoIIE family protein phosphatase [Burkholderiales bacterium]|nr:SpoIIE family protein phosphatase [Bacteroidia bacterium]